MRLRELENWLTAADVARLRGVSRQAVHKQLNDGKYRTVRTKLGFLVDPASVPEAHTGEGMGAPRGQGSKPTR